MNFQKFIQNGYHYLLLTIVLLTFAIFMNFNILQKESALKGQIQTFKDFVAENSDLQLQSEQLTTNNSQLSLHDTDLITIKIWSEYKYENCENWILEQIEKQKKEKRLYLLCKPDIPWQADHLRENPNNRVELFEIYKKELENLGHDYYVVEGKRRLETVIEKIYQLTTPN